MIYMPLSEKQKKIQKKWKKLGIQFDKELRDIIHGYIMSDGHVRNDGILTVEQSRRQHGFVQWLYAKLKLIRTPGPIQQQTRIDKRSKKTTSSSRFQTRRVCQGFRKMWYKCVKEKGKIRYRKGLPKSIHCFFNSTFISLWFAGDGTKMIGQRGAKFEVTCLTSEERLYLKQLFKIKFDIEVKILRAGKSKAGTLQWTLSITANEYEKFRTLITQMDLIPTLFPHKLCKKLNE